MYRLSIDIYGRVQGVCFRMFVQERALDFGCVGFVKNSSDGSVHVVAEGQESALKKLLDECRKGPAVARVESVSEQWKQIPDYGYSAFEIQ